MQSIRYGIWKISTPEGKFVAQNRGTYFSIMFWNNTKALEADMSVNFEYFEYTDGSYNIHNKIRIPGRNDCLELEGGGSTLINVDDKTLRVEAFTFKVSPSTDNPAQYFILTTDGRFYNDKYNISVINSPLLEGEYSTVEDFVAQYDQKGLGFWSFTMDPNPYLQTCVDLEGLFRSANRYGMNMKSDLIEGRPFQRFCNNTTGLNFYNNFCALNRKDPKLSTLCDNLYKDSREVAANLDMMFNRNKFNPSEITSFPKLWSTLNYFPSNQWNKINEGTNKKLMGGDLLGYSGELMFGPFDSMKVDVALCDDGDLYAIISGLFQGNVRKNLRININTERSESRFYDQCTVRTNTIVRNLMPGRQCDPRVPSSNCPYQPLIDIGYSSQNDIISPRKTYRAKVKVEISYSTSETMVFQGVTYYRFPPVFFVRYSFVIEGFNNCLEYEKSISSNKDVRFCNNGNFIVNEGGKIVLESSVIDDNSAGTQEGSSCTIVKPKTGVPSNSTLTNNQIWVTPNGNYFLYYNNHNFSIYFNVFTQSAYINSCYGGVIDEKCYNAFKTFSSKYRQGFMEYADPRSACVEDPDKIITTLFGSTISPAAAAQYKMLTPCLTEKCILNVEAGDTDSVAKRFVGDRCKVPIVICSSSVDTRNGSQIIGDMKITQNCGAGGQSSCTSDDDCTQQQGGSRVLGMGCNKKLGLCQATCNPDNDLCGQGNFCDPSDKFCKFMTYECDRKQTPPKCILTKSSSGYKTLDDCSANCIKKRTYFTCMNNKCVETETPSEFNTKDECIRSKCETPPTPPPAPTKVPLIIGGSIVFVFVLTMIFVFLRFRKN